MSITTIREKGVESIVDWFNQHNQSFYVLGWSYLSNQQQLEELFYRSIIKVHKEMPRFKSETPFETWVTSIFIHICRELSNDGSLQASEESEQQKDLFKALDQLKEDEKEGVVLTYVIGRCLALFFLGLTPISLTLLKPGACRASCPQSFRVKPTITLPIIMHIPN
ncbi:sigma-70 family RNA polymerase sigma factor [Neobacillus soli]|nr:sigma-70 family RNA polymerase sigma factor [Neobacillus soli]